MQPADFMADQNALKWVAGENTPEKTYITRVFNFGTLEEWREMKRRYAREKIERALRNPLPGQWTSHAKAFAEVVFDIRMPESVLISYDA